MTTIQELLSQGREALQSLTDTPQLDAEVLLGHVLKKDRLWLLSHGPDEIDEERETAFKKLLQRRKERIPVAYLTNSREFYGREFFVDERVLIPRPETELLVEKGLAHLTTLSKPELNVLDLGTGSGCLPITLLLEACEQNIPLRVIATDISQDALQVARKNAERFHVADQIAFLESNWFSALKPEQFDLIVSNPPYVERDSELSPEVLKEPHSALFAEEQGLSDIRCLLSGAREFLSSEGLMLIECGQGQWEALSERVCAFKGYTAGVYSDLSGINRIIKLQVRAE